LLQTHLVSETAWVASLLENGVLLKGNDHVSESPWRDLGRLILNKGKLERLLGVTLNSETTIAV